jgi:Undecaprenyl-phosphate glucose phosphotransferase
VVGQGPLAQALVDRIHRAPDAGIQLAGAVPFSTDAPGVAVDGSPLKVLGGIDSLESIVQTQSIEQVFIALPLSEQPRLGALVDTLSATAADVLVVPDLLQFVSLHGGSHDFDGVPVVALRHGPVHGWDAVSKRAFDLVFGGLILLLVSPIMLAVAAAVKLTSRGPVFYRQERMGLDGRTFHILKFRSMRIDAEQSGARWATSGDNRTTSIGAFLRKYSLDELPQFLNVLAGDMSLVGPRPERPVFIDKFKREIPRYQLRHKVKAGITGLAQVEGWRGNTSLERRIERDIYYIENWSLWLDFKILVRTALGGFLSKNAY